MKSFDVIVIGGGIVGLATAYGLSGQYPGKNIAVVEKEAGVARHQTGHNSGVLHSGIYYKPGSIKAATGRAGRAAMIAFCDREGIAYDLCGKVIVAVDEAELSRLEGLYRRGTDNGVSCELVSSAYLRDLEPHSAGIGGILVHDTGIVDYKQVCAIAGEQPARARLRDHDRSACPRPDRAARQGDVLPVRPGAGTIAWRVALKPSLEGYSSRCAKNGPDDYESGA